MSDQEANSSQAQMPDTTTLVHHPANANPHTANRSPTTPHATATSDSKAAGTDDRGSKDASDASGSGSEPESYESDSSAAATLYTSTSPPHGIGLFTTVAVAAGDLILCDPQLLVVEASKIPNQHSFLDQARLLNEARKGTLVGLGDRRRLGCSGLITNAAGLTKAIRENKPLATHFLVTTFWDWCYPFRQGEEIYVLLENTIYVNHSCRPNAEANVDTSTSCMNIRALRDMGAHEEITIAYVYPYALRQERQETLWFSCNCTACPQAPSVTVRPGRDLFDAREARLAALVEGLNHLTQYRSRFFGEKPDADFASMTMAERLETARIAKADVML